MAEPYPGYAECRARWDKVREHPDFAQAIRGAFIRLPPAILCSVQACQTSLMPHWRFCPACGHKVSHSK